LIHPFFGSAASAAPLVFSWLSFPKQMKLKHYSQKAWASNKHSYRRRSCISCKSTGSKMGWERW